MSGGSSDEDETSTVTWRELLEGAIATLRSRDPGDGSDPATDAARITAEALGVADAELVLHLSGRPTPRGVAHLDAMVARRATGEPLQYVLGHWPFRHLDLMVDRRVLIPRPESEAVVCGLALGWEDAQASVNRTRTEREPLARYFSVLR